MIGVLFLSVTTLHITTFIPWKRVDSTIQPWGWSRTTRNPPSPLHYIHRRHSHQRAHHVIYQPFSTISLVDDIGLCQYYQFKAANMYCQDGLCDSGSLTTEDVEVPEIYSPGARRLSSRCRWNRVEVVPTLVDWSGKTNGHQCWVP